MNNTIVEANKNLLRNLINEIHKGNGNIFYRNNHEDIFNIYKNFVSYKIASRNYNEEFTELSNTDCGKLILDSLQKEFEDNKTIKDLKKELVSLKKSSEKNNAVKRDPSYIERFFAVLLYDFIKKNNLTHKYGFLTHQKFLTDTYFIRYIEGKEVDETAALHRETDFQIINKETGEKFFFMVDSYLNHPKEKDDESSFILCPHGKVIRFREIRDKLEILNEKYCVEIPFSDFYTKSKKDRYRLMVNTNNAIKIVSNFIPELKNVEYSFSEIEYFLNNADELYFGNNENPGLNMIEPLSQLPSSEVEHIYKIFDELDAYKIIKDSDNEKFNNDKEMLEKFKKLYLTADIYKSLSLKPEWNRIFKKARALQTNISNKNKSNK